MIRARRRGRPRRAGSRWAIARTSFGLHRRAFGLVARVGRHDRQGEAEGGARARTSRVDPDAPAVALDDLPAQRQADAGARVVLLGVQPLEDRRRPARRTRARCRCRCRAPRTPCTSAVARGADRERRAAPSPRNLMALPIRFWKQRRPAGVASPRTAGSGVDVDRRRRSPRSAAARLATRLRRARRRGRPAPASTPCRPTRENVEQVVDQLLHPLGAVDGELDVLVGALVELAAVAALEQLAEAGDLAQRLLQVVRGDVGELLELGVRARELARLRLEARSRARSTPRARRRSAAHRLDVAGDRDDVRRGPPRAGLELGRRIDARSDRGQHERHADDDDRDHEVADGVGEALAALAARAARIPASCRASAPRTASKSTLPSPARFFDGRLAGSLRTSAITGSA